MFYTKYILEIRMDEIFVSLFLLCGGLFGGGVVLFVFGFWLYSAMMGYL